jgi:hypothetical protein
MPSLSSCDLPKGMDPALAAENPYKVFVQIEATIDREGRITPHSLEWEDGIVYPIDAVLKVEDHCAARSGGGRVRYTIQVNGKASYLYQ